MDRAGHTTWTLREDPALSTVVGDGLGEPVRFDAWDSDAPVVCAAGNAAVTDGAVTELLAGGPVVLDLARTGVTDDVVEGLVHCSSLQAVGLHGTGITPEVQ